MGLVDLVPAAESILLEFGPQVAHDDLLAERLDALVRQWSALPDLAPGMSVRFSLMSRSEFDAFAGGVP